MSRLRLTHARLLGLMLLSLTGNQAVLADPPAVMSPNVATADPLIPAPYTTPCAVALFTNQQFADYSAKPFAYKIGRAHV